MVFIDQMLNILVWDDFGSIKLQLSNRLFGVGTILVKFWNQGKIRKFGTLTWMYIHKYVGDSQKDLEILKTQAKKHDLDLDLPGPRIVQKQFFFSIQDPNKQKYGLFA